MRILRREMVLGTAISLLLHLLIFLLFPILFRRDRDDQSYVPSSPLVVSLQISRALDKGEVEDPPDDLLPPPERQVSPEKGAVSSPSRKEPNREAALEKLDFEPANPGPASRAGLMEKSLSDIPAPSILPDPVQTMEKEGAEKEGTEDLLLITSKPITEESRLGFFQGTEQQGSVREDNPVSLENFLRDLQETIVRDLIYPPAARNRGVEGRIIMEVWVGRDGSLKATGIKESSGSSILDRSALRLIRSLFPRNHDLDRDFKITLSIEYRLSS